MPENILVVDDSPEICFVVREALAFAGYGVEISGDGAEALEIFRNRKFDAVITDICMPGIDGNSLSRRIRGLAKDDIPIIGISGTMEFLETDNFNFVLEKPFSLKELLEAVTRLVAATPNSLTCKLQ